LRLQVSVEKGAEISNWTCHLLEAVESKICLEDRTQKKKKSARHEPQPLETPGAEDLKPVLGTRTWICRDNTAKQMSVNQRT